MTNDERVELGLKLAKKYNITPENEEEKFGREQGIWIPYKNENEVDVTDPNRTGTHLIKAPQLSKERMAELQKKLDKQNEIEESFLIDNSGNAYPLDEQGEYLEDASEYTIHNK